jgi:hypothetical protein
VLHVNPCYTQGPDLGLRGGNHFLPLVECALLGSEGSSSLPFAVGTMASKGMDRLSTFLSNPVVKKK